MGFDMIVVRVELWSAIDGSKTEIARMHIANDGHGTAKHGNYVGHSLRGRDSETLDQSVKERTYNRSGSVEDFPRMSLHVWNLVARMLKNMGYK